MNGDALIEGLQPAPAGVAIGEAVAHGVEYVVVGADAPADDQWPRVLQCLPYPFAARDLAEAGMPGIVAQDHHVAGEERRMSS